MENNLSLADARGKEDAFFRARDDEYATGAGMVALGTTGLSSALSDLLVIQLRCLLPRGGREVW